MIVIEEPFIEKNGEKSRLVCNTFVNECSKRIYFEVDKEYEKYLCWERCDAFVIGLLSWAMRKHHDIHCKAPITEELLYNINEYLIPSLTKYDKRLYNVKIIAPVETEATEVVETEEVEVVTEDEAAEETPTEDGVEEGTEEETEADEATEEEVEETEETETEESEEETVEEETEETTEDEEVEAEEETAESEEEPEVEEETEAESTVEDETEALKAKVAELNSKLEAYETAAKEELVTKFSSKINDSEFLSEVRDNLSSYSVESLKATLGAKLAEQVLVEETSEEERVNGMIYSFNGVASKETKKGWQELVRATKEAANRK